MSSSQLQEGVNARATQVAASAPQTIPDPFSESELTSRWPSDAPAPLPLNAWNITKVWGRKPGNRVIDDLDLTLEPGTLTWIGGSNGVGKTTLLRVLAGLIGPTEGHVHMFGLHPEHDRRAYQQRLSFLPATSTGLHARLTVRRQLDYTARINFVPRERRSAAVEESIKRFSLLELAKHRVDRLSMGQRQRVRLAMTFIKEPDLVLLDEPRNSLDGEGSAMLVAAVHEVVGRGGAVLWCSPLGESLGMRFDQQMVLEHGKLKRK
jgi:ABC-type multidrug transport system ATPase subunit